MFSEKTGSANLYFLLSPSLDLISIISVQALEAMKVASGTLQRSWCTLLAASSYLQPCLSTLLYTVPVILTVQFLSLAKMKTTASGVKCLLNLLY